MNEEKLSKMIHRYHRWHINKVTWEEKDSKLRKQILDMLSVTPSIKFSRVYDGLKLSVGWRNNYNEAGVVEFLHKNNLPFTRTVEVVDWERLNAYLLLHPDINLSEFNSPYPVLAVK